MVVTGGTFTILATNIKQVHCQLTYIIGSNQIVHTKLNTVERQETTDNELANYKVQ